MAGNPYKEDTSPYSYDDPKYASYALNSTAKLLSGATDEDLRVVTQKCAQDEKVIAVWRIPKEKQSTAACSMMPLALFYLPCFWPHALILSPCLCAGYCAVNASVKGTTYALTDRNFIRIADFDCYGGYYKSGSDSAATALSDIKAISVNAKASGCTACCSVDALHIGVPAGSPAANYGGRGASSSPHEGRRKYVPHSQIRCLMDDPENVRSMINSAKQNQNSLIAPETQAMEASQTAAEKILGLKTLLDAGAITQSEYELKKGELLLAM